MTYEDQARALLDRAMSSGDLVELAALIRDRTRNRRCDTCQHWKLPEDGDYTIGDRLILMPHPARPWEPMSEDETARMFGHKVRYCRHPKVLFFERPDIDCAAVVDGSEYRALLITGEAFGCVLHEEMEASA